MTLIGGTLRRLLATGAAVFAVATLAAWLTLSAVWPRHPVTVRIRWTPATTDNQRADAERRFHLTSGRLDEGTTWEYRLTDPSTSNIRALVLHGAVDDTAHLNRLRYRPEFAQDRSRQLPAAAVATGAFGAIAFVLVTRRRRRTVAPPGPERPLPVVDDWTAPESGPAARRQERLWSLAVLGVAAPLTIVLCTAMWRTPYPISETVSLLEDVEIAQERSLLSFFDPTARSWYRPLYHLTWSVLWRGTETQSTSLQAFKLFQILSAAVLILLLVRCVRPRTAFDAAAAAFALAVLVGMPGFRDNLELPLLMTLVGMPIALMLWWLMERPAAWWHGPSMVVLVLVAIGFKEQGLVLVPILLVAWWMGAPGVGRGTAAAVTAVALVYLTVRFGAAGSWRPFEQDVGLGFQVVAADDAFERFGAFPWWLYAYNAVSTAGNILFSEPSNGRFLTIRDALQGTIAPWQVNHVLSSLALTGLIAWWGVQVMRRDRGCAWSPESRVVVLAVIAVAASGTLGFNYARDRLGGMSVVFYALAAFHAVRAAAWRLTPPGTSGGLVVGLFLLAAAWQIRAVGTIEDVRAASEASQREWITALASRRADFADRTRYLRILESMAGQGLDPAAARRSTYPEWAASLLGEQ